MKYQIMFLILFITIIIFVIILFNKKDKKDKKISLKSLQDSQNCLADGENICNQTLFLSDGKTYKKESSKCCNSVLNNICVSCPNLSEDSLKPYPNLEINKQYLIKIYDNNNNPISINFDDNEINLSKNKYKMIINNDLIITFTRSLLIAKLLSKSCYTPTIIGSFIKLSQNKYTGQIYILGILNSTIGIVNNQISRNINNPAIFNITPTSNQNEYNLIITEN
jgi:hypothetical protein